MATIVTECWVIDCPSEGRVYLRRCEDCPFFVEFEPPDKIICELEQGGEKENE